MEKVKAGLRGLTPTMKLLRSRIVLEQMSNNPSFPNPVPSMAELAQACDELEEANRAALDRGRMACLRKRVAVTRMDEMLTRLAGYVNSAADGDTTRLLSSGFELVKAPEPISSLPQPQGLRALRTPYPDQLELRWHTVRGSLIYEVEEALDSDTGERTWQRLCMTSKPRLTVTEREPGRIYVFRVCAFGTKVQSPYSPWAYGKAA
jgi:hypothetical protein